MAEKQKKLSLAPFSPMWTPAGAERPDGGGLRPGYQRGEGGLHPAAQERILLGGCLAPPAQERGGHGGPGRDCTVVLFALLAHAGTYGYDQFNAGAENLYPWHYSLEAQQAYKEATSSQDPDEAVAAAEAEAAARGEELSSKDKALIRAQAKAGGGAEYEGMSEEEIYKALATPPSPSATPTTSCSRIADARRCSPMCSAPTATAAISWCAPCLPPGCP